MQPQAVDRRSHAAFTLIELLVVITIIVVLLALLVPALDRAIYQAELAVCAAQLGGMGKGVITYAAGHQRRYPVHPYVEADNPDGQPHDLAGGNATVFGEYGTDYRAMLKEMFSLKMLVDPLSEQVDLETQQGGGVLDLVIGSYCMWFGWQYEDHRGMFRLGDRFAWSGRKDPRSSEDPRLARFDLLVSDRHHLKIEDETQASHPDKDGVLQSIRLQNSLEHPWPVPFAVTASFWHAFTDTHGPMDMQYAHDNGSVSRIEDQEPYDPRTFAVGERRGGGNNVRHVLLIPE